MGKIKSKLVKRSANTLIKEGIEFSENFEKNKKILKDTMPSKKIRNQMAGFLSRLKRQERESRPKILENKKE
jgi:ribosomal protein S17E